MSKILLVEERRQLLDAALPHIPFDGWTDRVLTQAAADAGLDPALAMRAFPSGSRDLMAFFLTEADRLMVQDLEAMDLAAMRIRDRIASAVKCRVLQHAEHREALSRALGALALPLNMPLGLKLLYATVDEIWHAVGDTSTDFNFYTKRAMLGAVFSATQLYWLEDHSDDYAATWAFLDRRIADIMKIQKARGALAKRTGRWPQFLAAKRPQPAAWRGRR